MPVRKKSPAEKQVQDSAVSLVMAGITKAVGKDYHVVTVDEDASPIVGWLRTGIWALDYVIGRFRGIPLGRGLVVWGPESVGKTSFCDYLTWLIQKYDGVTVRLDYDDALDEETMAARGINLKRVITPEPDSMEAGFDAIKGSISSLYGKLRYKKGQQWGQPSLDPHLNIPMLIIWDSLNAAASRELISADTAEKSIVGVDARVLSAQYKRLRLAQRRRPILPVFTAEIREKIGGMSSWGGPQHNLAGGKASRHYPTTILKFTGKKMDKREKNGRKVTRGMWVYVTAEKARKGKMGESVMFYISHSQKPGEGGPDAAESNLAWLKDLKLLKPRGKDAFTIRGLEDKVGTFSKKEWPTIMARHETSILKEVKELVLSNQTSEPETDDADDDFEND